jgi:2-C-methyl-D-erythritol 4-phosphate cytidylyltransferase / 2-C-methyl-D-erythritol 2,4-cyclodiphosphate synthase
VIQSVAARRVFAVVPAAGRGERFEAASAGIVAAGRSLPKQYASLRGASVLEWSLRSLLGEPRVEGIVVVLAAGDAHGIGLIASLNDPRVRTAIGGGSRQESVMNGLEALGKLAAADDWILVHDAARPCLTPGDVRVLIDALNGGGCGCGAVLAAPIFDTVKRERGGVVSETLDRIGLWRALTPQAFGFAQLKHALGDAIRSGISVTDEAQAMERMGNRPMLVKGSSFNIKVTHAQDLAAAAGILQFAEANVMPGKIRIGQGFDVHAFGDGEHVVLGGVRIAYHRGVLAHSDGDVVIHALCDAVLGALGEGDIGQHFPDSDPRYRGADSRVFLREVTAIMRAAGLRVVNADITVLAEAPRIGAHRAAMAANLAADLGTSAGCINIKATTAERLGFVGRGEGLAAFAAVLLEGQDS